MTTTDTPRTPEELLESMTGMFLPPSAMGEVNGLKVMCLQRENKELKAEVERLKMRTTALDNITFDQADRLNECEANLRRAIEIAEVFASSLSLFCGSVKTAPEWAELDQLKATINPTDK